MSLENPPAVPLLGALCVADGLVSQAQLDACLQFQASSPTTPIGQILLQQGCLSEADLARMITQQRSFRALLVQRVNQIGTVSSNADEKIACVLQWGALTDDHRAYVRTNFAKLRVFLDPLHMSTGDAMRFCARVETIKGVELAAAENLASFDVARAWCEAQYAELLRIELEQVGSQR